MVNLNTAEKMFTSSGAHFNFGIDNIDDIKEQFQQLLKSGVIKRGTFDDDVWYTTDEYTNIGLHFKFNELAYRRNYQSLFKIDLSTFITSIKCLIISLFSQRALIGIYNVLLDIRHLVETNPMHLSGIRFTEFLSWNEWVISLLNENYSEEAISFSDAIEDYEFESILTQQRKLASFDTYFLFDDIINDYWGQNIPDDQREFYYPVYLWWKLTAVIPQRPREFLIMPRDCLSYENGKYYVKFRRNTNKGFSKIKTYQYTIDGAYSLDKYPVPDSIGKAIEKYLDITKGYSQTQLDTLFVTRPHYQKWGVRSRKDSRYFTYENFRTALSYFYEEIIVKKYGYKIVCVDDSSVHLNDGEIEIIRPGDTRHIALINLMQSGGTPFLAMLFAGHSNKDMALHYYSNIQSYIKCKTYREYRRFIANKSNYSITDTFTNPLVVKDRYGEQTELSSGFCVSQKYRSGDYYDCLCAVGNNGEIGFCGTCNYYRSNMDTAGDAIYEANLKADCEALENAVNLVRQNKGYPEDVAEVINRLHGTSLSYQDYLYYKHLKGEQDGQT